MSDFKEETTQIRMIVLELEAKSNEFREETTELIKMIAKELELGLSGEDIELFYEDNEETLINAAINGTLGYCIGYNLEGGQTK